MGIDDRSQFEMLEDLPGGLAALAQLVAAFHAAGVHVFIPYNPWCACIPACCCCCCCHMRVTAMVFRAASPFKFSFVYYSKANPCTYCRDTGTARDPDGRSDAEVIAGIMASIQADGFSGDTMTFIPFGM